MASNKPKCKHGEFDACDCPLRLKLGVGPPWDSRILDVWFEPAYQFRKTSWRCFICGAVVTDRALHFRHHTRVGGRFVILTEYAQVLSEGISE